MKEEKERGILYYLNPIVWIQMLFSYIMTIGLFINHFLAIILVIIIVSLIVFFSYDRYAIITYDGSVDSPYLGGVFGENKVYSSPLIRGHRHLIHDLYSYFAKQRNSIRSRKKYFVTDDTDEISYSPSSIQKEINSRVKRKKSAK